MGWRQANPLTPLNLISDQALIACIQTKDSGETIPGAVLKLAKGLGINTIAEGVENERQLSWLMSMNCNYAQGHFFHAPIPLQTFDLYLRGGVFASSEREGLAQYRLTNS